MPRTYLYKFYQLLLVALLLSGLFMLRSTGRLGKLSNQISDPLIPSTISPPQVSIIDINENDLSDTGLWPWESVFLSEIVTKLESVNARAVVIDLPIDYLDDHQDVIIPILKDSDLDFVVPTVNGIYPNPAYFRLNNFSVAERLILSDGVNNPVREYKLYDGGIRSLGLVSLLSYYEMTDSWEGDFPSQFGFVTVESPDIVVKYYGESGQINSIGADDFLLIDSLRETTANDLVYLRFNISEINGSGVNVNTPHGEMTDIELHASVAASVINNNYLRAPDPALVSLFLILFSVVLILIMLLIPFPITFLLDVIAFFGYVGLSILLLGAGHMIDFVYAPIMIITVTVVGLIGYLYSRLSREINYEKQLFPLTGKPSGISNKSIKEALQGKNVEGVILTGILPEIKIKADKESQDKWSMLLRGAVFKLAELTAEHMGLFLNLGINEFFSVWGVFKKNKKDARNACKTGLKTLNEFDENHPLLKIASGGKLTVGVDYNDFYFTNVGKPRNLNISVSGDALTISKILAKLCNHYGVNVIISQNVVKELVDTDQASKFRIRWLDRIKIKNQKRPIDIFELFPTKIIHKETPEMIESFEEGVEKYIKGEFKEAEEIFKGLRLKYSDKPSMIMAERCKVLLDKDVDWSGYWLWRMI